MTKPHRRLRFDDAPPSVFDFRFVLGRRWEIAAAAWVGATVVTFGAALLCAAPSVGALRVAIGAAVLGTIPAALVMVDLVLEILCSLDEADAPEEL